MLPFDSPVQSSHHSLNPSQVGLITPNMSGATGKERSLALLFLQALSRTQRSNNLGFTYTFGLPDTNYSWVHLPLTQCLSGYFRHLRRCNWPLTLPLLALKSPYSSTYLPSQNYSLPKVGSMMIISSSDSPTKRPFLWLHQKV